MNITRLGTAIIERDGPSLLVLLPDGEIRGAANVAEAKRMLDKWQAARTPKDSMATLRREWRCIDPTPGKNPFTPLP